MANIIEEFESLTPDEQEQLDDATLKEVEDAYNKRDKPSLGSRTIEGAIAGSGWDEIKKAFSKSTYKKGQTPKELGQSIKAVAKLPINVVTAVPGAVGGAVMGATGLSAKIGEQLAKLTPEQRDAVIPALEILGVLGAKGIKSPLKFKPKLNKTVARSLEKDIETASKTGIDVAGENIITKAGQKQINVGKNQFVPAKKAVEGLKVSKNVGNNVVLKIRKNLAKGVKELGVHPKNVKPIIEAVDFIKNAKDLKGLIKGKQTLDAQFRGMWRDNPTLADEGMKTARRFINEEIKKQIKDPIIKKNWIEANQAWQDIADGITLIKRAENTAETNVFKNLINKPKSVIDKAKNIAGDDAIRTAGFSYLYDKAFDTGTGVFVPRKFAKAIGNLQDIRGKAIFGEQWQGMKELQNIIQQMESPDSLIQASVKGLPVAKNVAKYIGGKDFQKILKGGTSGILPFEITNKLNALVSNVVPAIAKGTTETIDKEISNKIKR